MLLKELKQAAVSKIIIERPHKKCRVTIHSARPGVIIGKKGADIEKLRGRIAKITDSEVLLNIVEVRKPEIDAQLVADGIAQQLERRVGFRRAMKRAVQSAIRLGAEGIRINCGGRLGGVPGPRNPAGCLVSVREWLRLFPEGGRRRCRAFVLDQVFCASDDFHADDFVVNLHVSQQLLVIDDVTKDGVSSV